MSNKYRLPILLYDSECTLCTRFMHSLQRVDPEDSINKLSIHDDAVYELYDFLDKKKCEEDVHYIDEDKVVHVGGDAVAELIKLYPTVKSFAWLLDSEMGKKSLDLFYSAASTMRKQKKCSTCDKKRSAKRSCNKKLFGIF